MGTESSSEALAIALQHQQAGRLDQAERTYREILKAEPNHAEATHLLGAIAHQCGNHDAAIDLIRRAIILDESHAEFHYNLAKAYRALHRIPDAIDCYRRAALLNPEFFWAHNNLGNVLTDAGEIDEGITALRRAVELGPDSAVAHKNLGNALILAGRTAEASACFCRALELKPDFVSAYDSLGNIYRMQGEVDKAMECYSRCVELKPDWAEAHNNLGAAMIEKGMIDAAISCLRRSLQLNPDLSGAHNNMGNCLMKQALLKESIACYREAVRLNPANAEAYHNLGLALRGSGHLNEAARCISSALELMPELAEAHRSLGLVRLDQGDLDDAVACFLRALEIASDPFEPHNDLGVAFTELKRPAEAIACFRRALAIAPAAVETRFNLATTLLMIGCYEEGWIHYESRLSLSPPRAFACPRWKRSSSQATTILLHSEQGFGDMICFFRYAAILRDRAEPDRLILEVPPNLYRLFAQNVSAGIEILTSESGASAPAPPFDAHLPLLSVPFALGLTNPSPRPGRYLHAIPEGRAAWSERMRSDATLRVGLAWKGNPGHERDRLRSIACEKLLPLFGVAGVCFYSLQIGANTDETATLAAAGVVNFTTELDDFADTAALVSELDLMISVDTAVAHLAGALGRPVWTLLPFVPDWRWGLEGESTPWYPTMRLFRQPKREDWDSVLRRVGEELGKWRKSE